MKLNKANKFYLLIFAILFIATIVKMVNHKPWGRYFYVAVASAPEANPIFIRNIAMLTPEGQEIYISPDAINLNNSAWGESSLYPESHRSQILPDRLVLNYVDYRTSNFYADTLALPVEDMETYFKEALAQQQGYLIYKQGMPQQGMQFHVGIANKGHVLVWLQSANHAYKLMEKQLQPKSPDIDDLKWDGSSIQKEDYLKEVFLNIPDSLKTKIDAGWESNANYKDSIPFFMKK